MPTTPPKWWITCLFCMCFYHFWVGFEPIFKNHVFRAVLESFSPFKRPKTRNRWPSQKNAPIIVSFAEMGCQYTGPKLFWQVCAILVHPSIHAHLTRASFINDARILEQDSRGLHAHLTFQFFPNFKNVKKLPHFLKFSPFSKFWQILKKKITYFQDFYRFSYSWPIFKIQTIFKITIKIQNFDPF